MISSMQANMLIRKIHAGLLLVHGDASIFGASLLFMGLHTYPEACWLLQTPRMADTIKLDERILVNPYHNGCIG